jgi:hypothetical protein
MPENFDKCVKNGGDVRTVSGPDKHFDLKEGEYRKVCWKNGEAVWGHKERKKKDG